MIIWTWGLPLPRGHKKEQPSDVRFMRNENRVFAIDLTLIYERKEALRLQKLRNNTLWGTAIGIKYISIAGNSRSRFLPYKHESIFFELDRIDRRTGMTVNHMLEVCVNKGPLSSEEFKLHDRWQTHVDDDFDDFYKIDRQNYELELRFWLGPYRQEYELLVKNWEKGASDLLWIRRRFIKWERLRVHRLARYTFWARKISFFSLINQFLLDWKRGFFHKKV